MQNVTPQASKPRAPQQRVGPSEQGFTMIELLVTMLLLTVVLTGLAALQVSTIQQVTASKRAGEATRLAQLVIERYKNREFSTITKSGPAGEAPSWDLETYNNQQLQRIRPERDSTGQFLSGPFSVYSVREQSTLTDGAWLITIQVRWMGSRPIVTATGDREYPLRTVTISMQLFP